MLAASALVEVLVGITGEVAEAFVLILHGVAVHDVHDDGDAHLMCGVDELLQFLGCSETAAGSEETADMVSEAAVVWMLLDGHDLDAVVTIFVYAGQDVLTELVVRSHAFLVLCHTDMAFVDEQRRGIRAEFLHLPLVGFLTGHPHLCREYLRIGILHHTGSPCGYAFALSPFPTDEEFVQLSVLQALGRQFDFPGTVALGDAFHRITRFGFPVVEFADDINLGGVGSPLTQEPFLVLKMQSEVQVTRSEIR